MSREPTVREASHAGSWYSSNGEQLAQQLDHWLAAVDRNVLTDGTLPLPGARAIISPHAGFAYSGPAAAWAYASLDLSKAKRIFLIHPSHHVYFKTASLPRCTAYETPLSDEPLLLDGETIGTLLKTTSVRFERTNQRTDEDEHSGEMQLPYIHRLLQKLYPGRSASSYPRLVPIMVGSTDKSTERALGKVLAPYIADEENVFVISSDFCHWGSRFSYTYYKADAPSPAVPSTSLPNGVGDNAAVDVHQTHDWSQCQRLSKHASPSSPRIFESIAHVDRACMCAIASGNYDEFAAVIEATRNTVCGRHPIGVFMAGLEEVQNTLPASDRSMSHHGKFRFMRYERSSDVEIGNDSSVSYVSAFAVF